MNSGVIKILFPIALILVVLSSCDQRPEESKEDKKELPKVAGFNPFQDSKVTVDVFKIDSIETNGSRGWGYDIMIDGKLYIHQPNIPSIMGNNGFSSEEKAREAGDFIVYKIKNNILPPAVTPEELDSLGLLE